MTKFAILTKHLPRSANNLVHNKCLDFLIQNLCDLILEKPGHKFGKSK